ncbi:surfeit locus protein 2 [Corythoichthys intestinalis]|uniref:surfeit locus protein 2 n=1 Tax=Corythoichthys intestinalis TaxID=161448 RepID=UPI0025A551A8|nr:surfeit locus protein 2 [Corythoichthys intestinalis]XP_057675693.1 surfeit locus protein 2 [Corythoichthys intestinalis]XP_061800892.1 surfeit locus protein 2-like [Nerophis lumbriciformis]
MDDLPADVKAFLLGQPFFQLTDSKKIKCTLNGHEFPCSLETLQNFTKGKKYEKLCCQAEFNYTQYEPHIVPSSKQPKQLFCKLTLRHLNKQPHHVLKHVNGKRFKKALAKYDECVKQGIEFIPIRLQNKRPKDTSTEVQKGRKSKQGNGTWEPSSSDDEGRSDSEDSMSDLYPPSMFTFKNPDMDVCQDEDDFQTDEDNEMEVDMQAVQKRKKVQGGGGSQKKFKNNRKGRKKKPVKVWNGK